MAPEKRGMIEGKTNTTKPGEEKAKRIKARNRGGYLEEQGRPKYGSQIKRAVRKKVSIQGNHSDLSSQKPFGREKKTHLKSEAFPKKSVGGETA